MRKRAHRYRLLVPAPRLEVGDVVLGWPYVLNPGSDSNPGGKVTIVLREVDQHSCVLNLFWSDLHRLPGSAELHLSADTGNWVIAERRKPSSRKKRWSPFPGMKTARR